jgi:flagellar protein FliO/FliZ
MDTVTMVGRLLVSLAAVLGLMWFVGRRVRKGGKSKTKNSRLIDVLGRQQLSRNSSVAVVRVGEQALIIGVSDGNVNILGETDLGAAQAIVASGEIARPRGRTERSTATTGSHRAPALVDNASTTEQRGALSGSALSPQTWKQTIESLREMTARST